MWALWPMITKGWMSTSELSQPLQSSPLTMTPSGQDKSVTVSKCHCNHIILIYERPFGTCQNCHCKWGVTVNGVTVSRKSVQISPLTVTPVTVTPRLQWQFPKWPIIYKSYLVTVTPAYSDTFLLSRGCHCKRGSLYYRFPRLQWHWLQWHPTYSDSFDMFQMAFHI